jgi:replicative DNA helicase
MNKRFDHSQFVHTPAEMATEFAQWAKGVRRSPGITWGVQPMDKCLLPLGSGRLMALIGRPGHCKTSLLLYHARREARRIVEEGTQDTECVVYVTYEQSSEELTAILQDRMKVRELVRGQVDEQTIDRESIPIVRLPIWTIGQGLGRATPGAPRMTAEAVYQAIEWIKRDYGLQVRLMCFDYLQLIPVDHARDRIQQVTEAPIRIKELALRVGCPTILAVQARREVDQYKTPMPHLSDPQWASSIEQTCDVVFGLLKPINVWGAGGAPIPIDGQLHDIDDKLLIIRLLKQRFEFPAVFQWALSFDIDKLQLWARSAEEEPPWTQ